MPLPIVHNHFEPLMPLTQNCREHLALPLASADLFPCTHRQFPVVLLPVDHHKMVVCIDIRITPTISKKIHLK